MMSSLTTPLVSITAILGCFSLKFMNHHRSSVLALACLIGLSVAIVDAATFTVTNTTDAGAGSLRQAILDANANPGQDKIRFQISAPLQRPQTISPLSPLPTITDRIHIDGYTQIGAAKANKANPASLKIVIDGSNTLGNGLEVAGGNSIVEGLVIHSFLTGFALNSSNNRVLGNYMGTNAAGTQVLGNNVGISINFDHNIIGGTAPADRNIIAGSEGAGVIIYAMDNQIQGNLIGTDVSTTQDLGNGGGGVLIYDHNNTVGGTEVGAGNVISGNSGGGVILSSNGNTVQGNVIGTDASGTHNSIVLGNIVGVLIDTDAENNTIGGTEIGAGNLISNNIGEGMEIYGHKNIVQGNMIGTDITATVALGNYGSAGVRIYGNGNLIGDSIVEARNIISGNFSDGIHISANVDLIDGQVITTPVGNIVQGNHVGLDITGSVAIPNGANGVTIADGVANLIGGIQADAENIIAGNDGNGIEITSFAQIASANLVLGNVIGTDATQTLALGNAGSGVRIVGANNNLIGGTTTTAGNIITRNFAGGVVVASGVNNALLRNAIYDNWLLGIDLGDDWITLNDVMDSDIGANNLQNTPELSAATTNGISTTVDWTLHSTPNTMFRLEFYATAVCDTSSNHGEGETFVGSLRVTTDTNGDVSGASVLGTAVSVGHALTATASPITGLAPQNTSEFSACVTVL